MPRVTIRRFRAAFARRCDPDALVRACRRMAGRPDLAAAVRWTDGSPWTVSTAAA